MAEDQRQTEDVVVDDEDFTKDPAPVENPTNKPDLDVFVTEAPPTPISKRQKTTARCKRRADHILHILEECWWNSVYGVLICDGYEELYEALEDEKNYTSEAMQKLVLEARDLFTKKLTKNKNEQIALSKYLTKAWPSHTGFEGIGPAGPWKLREIQERVIERMDRKIDSITSSPGDYEWGDAYE
ncbi:hypothetical protein D0863_13432 [Hortaea werneckii]|uniref:Uncharacterized protein n=1 Tax=Hortaea werneckii TaxID=91943 RepID=A0A3M7CTS9_HORWE|nr:hypothetical protein D0863_13432 [Hortaea werneckii]